MPTGWLKGLEVSAGGAGVVSHAGVVLVRALADGTGLTGGLSRALASRRLLIHDRGRVLADLASAIADGAEVISDFRVMADQGGLFGPVASVPTCWRALNEIAGGAAGEANPAPRSTIPASASHNGSARVVITAANAYGNAVQKMTRSKTSQTWLASHTGVIDSSISVRGARPARWCRPAGPTGRRRSPLRPAPRTR